MRTHTLILLSVLFATVSHAQVPPTAEYQTAQQATVSVITTHAPGEHGFPVHRGSAVWLGDSGYLATCEHVVHGLTGPFVVGVSRGPFVGGNAQTQVVVGGMMPYISVTLVASDADSDVAILKAEKAPSAIQFGPTVSGATKVETPQYATVLKGAKLNPEYPKPGEVIFLAGYPLEGHDFIFASGNYSNVGMPGAKNASGIRLMLSITANPGNSGGPVFNEKGELVGLLEGYVAGQQKDSAQQYVQICSRVVFQPDGTPAKDAQGQIITAPEECRPNSGIEFAVPARFIVALAKANNLDIH
jgi:S1-C subfamily serine protease